MGVGVFFAGVGAFSAVAAAAGVCRFSSGAAALAAGAAAAVDDDADGVFSWRFAAAAGGGASSARCRGVPSALLERSDTAGGVADRRRGGSLARDAGPVFFLRPDVAGVDCGCWTVFSFDGVGEGVAASGGKGWRPRAAAGAAALGCPAVLGCGGGLLLLRATADGGCCSGDSDRSRCC